MTLSGAKGEHAGRPDIKHDGITIIIGNLGRAYAIGAGLTGKRTIARQPNRSGIGWPAARSSA